jgi:hypothetical protein
MFADIEELLMNNQNKAQTTLDAASQKSLADTFGVRSYQTLVRDEVVLAPPISHQQKLIEAVTNLVKK